MGLSKILLSVAYVHTQLYLCTTVVQDERKPNLSTMAKIYNIQQVSEIALNFLAGSTFTLLRKSFLFKTNDQPVRGCLFKGKHLMFLTPFFTF